MISAPKMKVSIGPELVNVQRTRNDMKRVVIYYTVGMIAFFGLLTFIDIDAEDGRVLLSEVAISTCVFMFTFFGRDLIVRHPLLVLLVPVSLLLLGFLGF